MSVSLKKPDRTEKKLPEYTPVHLIDEEETIKNLSARSVTSTKRDIQPQTRQCTPVHIREEQETINSRSVSELRQYENERRKQKKWYVLAWFGAVALVILVCAAFFSLVVNMPFEPVEMPAEEITSNMTEVEYIFSVVSSVIEWFFGSPLFMALFSLIAIGLLVRCIRKIMQNNRF